jgi:hypothetical protein
MRLVGRKQRSQARPKRYEILSRKRIAIVCGEVLEAAEFVHPCFLAL